MPKFQKIRKNPTRLAKFRGMVHCTCCANSTRSSKFIRVFPHPKKSGKKTSTIRSGIGEELSADTKTNQVIARPLSEGPKSQPNGQRSKRRDSPSPVRCQSPVVELGSSTCPSWTTARSYDPNLCNCDLTGRNRGYTKSKDNCCQCLATTVEEQHKPNKPSGKGVHFVGCDPQRHRKSSPHSKSSGKRTHLVRRLGD